MNPSLPLVVFRVEAQRFALGLEVVERIVRAVEITPLPQAPATVLGVINVAGAVLPVLSPRRRLGFPDRPVGPEDQFILAHLPGRAVALVVDLVERLVEVPASAVLPPALVPAGLGPVPGVVRLADGLVLIQDLAAFFSPAEAQALATALENRNADAEVSHAP